jgi:hypothetical protein
VSRASVSVVLSPAKLAALVAEEREPVDVTPHPIDRCPRWPREGTDGLSWDEGPCPYVSCRHHLHSDVLPDGSLRIYRPGLEVDQLPDTCSIDVARRGTHGFDVIGWYLGISERQAWNDYSSALRKIAAVSGEFFGDFVPGARQGGLLKTGTITKHDPRVDDPDALDREIPEGYAPRVDTEVEIVGTHREIPRLTGEHLQRQYRLPRMAERLYLMLISDASLRRCGLSDLVRAYAELAGVAVARDRAVAALADLETAGLVICDWRACGKIRRLRGVSLVSSLRYADDVTNRDVCEDQ